MKKSFVLAFSLALATHIASAFDPMPLQDFCVAGDEPKDVFVNGKFCKDPKCVVAEDFFTWGLDILLSTDNAVGSNVTGVNVDRIPGLNTLGVSIARFDYATYGVNEPRINPRASEMLVVQEGTLYVGFVASNREGNRLFAKVLKKGDVFVVPIGLPHFQMNIGKTPAVAYAAFNSQNPVDVAIPKTLFGSDPLIDPEVLPRAFQLDEKVVEYLQARFQDRNSFP